MKISVLTNKGNGLFVREISSSTQGSQLLARGHFQNSTKAWNEKSFACQDGYVNLAVDNIQQNSHKSCEPNFSNLLTIRSKPTCYMHQGTTLDAQVNSLPTKQLFTKQTSNSAASKLWLHAHISLFRWRNIQINIDTLTIIDSSHASNIP